MESSNLCFTVPFRDIGDFYRMLRDFMRNRGNTFVYLQHEIEERFPKLKEHYDDGTVQD